MPKRTDLKTILVIGSGPIVIGQGCEFDYSGVQACKALRREGYRVVLINSNPATIMTDPEFADATYVEPMTPAVLKMIIEKERPDALLPTMGGQTALNLAMDLYHNGTLEQFGVEMIGATAEAIDIAEDRKRLRDMAKLIIGRVGLETGGANIQFAVEPHTGEVVIIEMNPRVSRSSALASKATGFPIAKIAALVAVGYTLDEIPNDITQKTPASFEPSLDYVVVKIPRWNFEKFKGIDSTLGPQMKAIGEVMAIGRTFPEALQKAISGLDIGMKGFGAKDYEVRPETLRVPTAQRLYEVASALRLQEGNDSSAVAAIAEASQYDPWFVSQLRSLQTEADLLRSYNFEDVKAKGPEFLQFFKRLGFFDPYLADLLKTDEITIRNPRKAQGVTSNFYCVNTYP